MFQVVQICLGSSVGPGLICIDAWLFELIAKHLISKRFSSMSLLSSRL